MTDAPSTLRYRGRLYAITPGGVTRDGEPVARAELLRTGGPESSLWRWLREHGARRSDGGTTERVLGGWRVAPATKERVARAAEREGVSESAWVERAIVGALSAAAPK